MNIQKKIFAGGCALLIAFASLTTASAAVATGVYQTVKHVDIPGGGETNYDTTYGSQKTDSDNYATFLETYKQAALGNFAHLITSSKLARSVEKGLIYETPVLARESNVTQKNIYYSAVSSNAFEPSNTCDVIIKFSADNFK